MFRINMIKVILPFFYVNYNEVDYSVQKMKNENFEYFCGRRIYFFTFN